MTALQLTALQLTGVQSAVARLRAATAPDHDTVDAAFGRYDLSDASDYRKFLIAHARALPAAEAWLQTVEGLPPFRPRTPLLTADLAALDEPMPLQTPIDTVNSTAAAWGALYVIEGSRLGGVLLSRGVPEGMPSAYLEARHVSGEWRALLTAIDAEANGDEAWIADAIKGAKAAFALYRTAS